MPAVPISSAEPMPDEAASPPPPAAGPPARHHPHAEPDAAPPAVQGVAWLLVRDGCVLLERCPKKARVLGVGEWFVPGGKLEPGEVTSEALQREIAEEWPGVELLTWAPLPILEGSPVPPGPRGLFLMRPYVVAVRGDPGDASGDGVPLRWVPLAEALASPVPQVRMMVAAAMAVAPAPRAAATAPTTAADAPAGIGAERLADIRAFAAEWRDWETAGGVNPALFSGAVGMLGELVSALEAAEQFHADWRMDLRTQIAHVDGVARNLREQLAAADAALNDIATALHVAGSAEAVAAKVRGLVEALAAAEAERDHANEHRAALQAKYDELRACMVAAADEAKAGEAERAELRRRLDETARLYNDIVPQRDDLWRRAVEAERARDEATAAMREIGLALGFDPSALPDEWGDLVADAKETHDARNSFQAEALAEWERADGLRAALAQTRNVLQNSRDALVLYQSAGYLDRGMLAALIENAEKAIRGARQAIASAAPATEPTAAPTATTTPDDDPICPNCRSRRSYHTPGALGLKCRHTSKTYFPAEMITPTPTGRAGEDAP